MIFVSKRFIHRIRKCKRCSAWRVYLFIMMLFNNFNIISCRGKDFGSILQKF